MYCINCGVKLADTEKSCPLCGTQVFHPTLTRPEGEPLYPQGKKPLPVKTSRVAQTVVTVLFLLPLLLVLIADLRQGGGVSWSGYVIGALLVGYVCVVLPVWFQKPNPVIFVPCGFASVLMFLLYIDLVNGGGWFLSFAFPVVGGLGIIVTAMTSLLRYVRRGKLYIYGGTAIAIGGLMLATEFLLDITFGIPRFYGWSLYPLTTLVLLGGLLIFLAICRSARQTMERKFFI